MKYVQDGDEDIVGRFQLPRQSRCELQSKENGVVPEQGDQNAVCGIWLKRLVLRFQEGWEGGGLGSRLVDCMGRV